MLALLSSCKEEAPFIDMREECVRLRNNDYDLDVYSDDIYRCIYIRDGEDRVNSNYTFSHRWSLLEVRMWNDSLICGYKTKFTYGYLEVISNDVNFGDTTLTCN